jgi:hypothetical protein
MALDSQQIERRQLGSFRARGALCGSAPIAAMRGANCSLVRVHGPSLARENGSLGARRGKLDSSNFR